MTTPKSKARAPEKPTAVRREERRFATVGRIAPSRSGEVMVDFGEGGARAARVLSGADRDALLRPESRGLEVLLLFADGNPDLPIVVGRLDGPAAGVLSLLRERPEPKSAHQAVVDGDRVTIVAEKEITLKCGEGSITIRKDGKIVVKGTHLLTRSTGPHRIKGARVDIN